MSKSLQVTWTTVHFNIFTHQPCQNPYRWHEQQFTWVDSLISHVKIPTGDMNSSLQYIHSSAMSKSLPVTWTTFHFSRLTHQPCQNPYRWHEQQFTSIDSLISHVKIPTGNNKFTSIDSLISHAKIPTGNNKFISIDSLISYVKISTGNNTTSSLQC
jgi:hypothetical protein